MSKTLQQPGPTRKQQFNAALALAGTTAKEWVAEHSEFGYEHLYKVLTGERDGSAEFNRAIDSFISRTIDSYIDHYLASRAA